MSVTLDGQVIRLEGVCRLEEAEPLSAWLQADPSRVVDVTACTDMHAAVVQVLVAFAPSQAGDVGDRLLAQLLSAPALARPMSTIDATRLRAAAKEVGPEAAGGRSSRTGVEGA